MDIRAFLIGGLAGAAAIGAVGVVRFGWPDLNNPLGANVPAVTEAAPKLEPAAPSPPRSPRRRPIRSGSSAAIW